MATWYKPMQTPSPDMIKDREGKFYLIRKESYNHRTTPLVEWAVAEKMQDDTFRLERWFKTKGDAKQWLYICAKV